MSSPPRPQSVTYWNEALSRIDERLPSTPAREVPTLLRSIPLDVFALLLLERPATLPNLRHFLPPLPSGEVQESWNGAQGRELMRMSVDFITRVVARYRSAPPRALEHASVLDFGCGWGRLMRLMYRYVPYEQLYGVDPWETSLELCREHGLKGHLALSDYVPRELPFDRRFDLIYAFSVFTHLSERTTRQVLTTLRRHIADDGWLMLTLRPEEYWYYHQDGIDAAERIETHRREGFVFEPHQREPIDGDITYGDTSMTLDWLQQATLGEWTVSATDYCMGDLLQVIVALRPS